MCEIGLVVRHLRGSVIPRLHDEANMSKRIQNTRAQRVLQVCFMLLHLLTSSSNATQGACVLF